MELVEFSNGKYAIRLSKEIKFLGIVWRSDRYLDLKAPSYKWSQSSEYFNDCLTKDLDAIEESFEMIKSTSLKSFINYREGIEAPKVIRK